MEQYPPGSGPASSNVSLYLREVSCVVVGNYVMPLGAEGVLPSKQIESFLGVFKQFTHTLASR